MAVKAGDVRDIAEGSVGSRWRAKDTGRFVNQYESIRARFAPEPYLEEFRQLLGIVRRWPSRRNEDGLPS